MPFHETPARYAQAVLGCGRRVAVLLPPLGEKMLGVLGDLAGLLVPGSPERNAGVPRPGARPPTLPLIRAAIETAAALGMSKQSVEALEYGQLAVNKAAGDGLKNLDDLIRRGQR